MKNTEIPIITISLRLGSKSRTGEFYPFIEWPEARFFILDKLYQFITGAFKNAEVHQLLSEIIIIIPSEDHTAFSSVADVLPAFSKSICQYNKNVVQKNKNHLLTFSMAVDAGTSSKLTLPARGNLPEHTAWTGLHMDRVSNLTQKTLAKDYPKIIITHAFYKNLPAIWQAKYKRPYYLLHICCYAEE